MMRIGILYYARKMKGVIDGCLRVTVGTPDENNFFLKALKSVKIKIG